MFLKSLVFALSREVAQAHGSGAKRVSLPPSFGSSHYKPSTYSVSQVGLFLSQFVGLCSPAQHSFKLNFLRIICDHDFYIETPGRVAIEK